MTPTRRSFFASLAALAVAPKVLRTPAPSASAMVYLADHSNLPNGYARWSGYGLVNSYIPDRIRYSDLHESHVRMHLEDLRTGYEPMTPWDKARLARWRRHIRQHELAMERASNRA